MHHTFKFVRFLFLILLLSLFPPSFSLNAMPVVEDGLYLGLNYPGVSLGYQAGSYGLEFRGFSDLDGDILVYGLRGSHIFHRFRNHRLYLGAEVLYVEHESTITEGDGYIYGGFGGFRSYFTRRLAFNLDLGPYRVHLEDDPSGLDSSGIHYILNAGVSIHF